MGTDSDRLDFCRAKGLEVINRNEIKPVATIPITDKTRASISSGRALLKRLTAKVQPVRISAHNSKEPSCPPQIALSLMK
jgi:hypothetical protein